MKNKALFIGIFLIFILILSACANRSFKVEVDQITVKVGDSFQINLSEGNLAELSFSEYDETLINISENGLITALNEGVTEVLITHKKDSKISKTITVTIRKVIQISTPDSIIQMVVGDEETLEYSSNDEVTFTSSDTSILEISNSGYMIAKREGSITLTIQSTYDQEVAKTITVHVLKVVDISLLDHDVSLVVGEDFQLDFESEEDVIISSLHPNVAGVNHLGVISANQAGETIITLRSAYNENIFKEVSVKVYEAPTSIVLVSNDGYNINEKILLDIAVSPLNGYPLVRFESSHPLIADFDDLGYLNTFKTGIITVTAYSLYDDSILSVKTIEIFNHILVDTISTTNEVTYQNTVFTFGKNYYSNLIDALDNATENAVIFIINGNHSNDYVINKEGIHLKGDLEASFTGTIKIAEDNITISNLSFNSNAKIINDIEISSFIFTNNQVSNITHQESFIHLNLVNGVNISSNTFESFNGHAIVIDNYLGGEIFIFKNTINNVDQAIKIDSELDYLTTTSIKVIRNDISNIHTALNIETRGLKILAYARFNSISNYAIGAINQSENKVDFTLNYWGESEPNYTKFNGISETMLRGYYQTKTSIPTEQKYNPLLPLVIEVFNPIDLIMIGETHRFNIGFLPLEYHTTNIRYITSNPALMSTSNNGTITPLKSGIVTITIRSSIDILINTTVQITILTDPGIEISLSKQENSIITGDTLTMSAVAFPFNIVDAPIVYESLDTNIATITQDGLITTHHKGIVTLKASLYDNPEVSNEITIEVFDSLNQNHLLDLLTTNSMIYSRYREWLQYGVSFNYLEKRHESVNRYHFNNLFINESKILPIFYYIRIGEPMDPLPENVTQYNPHNVHWVVMHETAGTNTGAGALSHANYLMSETIKQNQNFVSWHFTVDHKEIYQHIPETERAFHAGDGSSRPGTSLTYLGGGNRNGIGIEMSVALDEDMMTTLHRASKLAAKMLVRYNLPVTHMKYHQDFSGKVCPQGLIRANMLPFLESLALVEYQVEKNHNEAIIQFESHNPEYLDQTGRIIKFPERGLTVSYTVTVIENNITESRTFYTYIPGQIS